MADTPDQQPDPLEKSLGDQATGTDASHVDRELSLGDQSTSGDALSSMSDLVDDLGEAIDSDLPLIDLVARYEIEGELGQGGMGAVLLATDRQLKRKVAIKRILGSMAQSKTALQRFVTEAQSIAALNHFNIVQVYEFGRDAEGPLLVLEYVGGGSLLDKLKDGKLEVEEAVNITCQLCDALSKAHGAGIIHRDIKPANILLTEDGAPKLTDFGLARQQAANYGQTQEGAVLGTIDFMSPEQRRDATSTDSRSDLWSLAATLYQMLTGKSPRIINFRNVPQALQDVLQKALEEEQIDRYQTAREFRDALKDSLATTTESVPEVVVDLGAGECAQCHTKNESTRKFCSECAAPLRVDCLACEEEIPVWDKICGKCGGKQPELLSARQDELTSLEKEIRDDVKNKQIDGLLEKTTHFLELNPRHEKVQKLQQQLLQRLQQANKNELASLEQQIREGINNNRTVGLLEKTTRFLQLKPDDLRVQKLHEQLTDGGDEETIMIWDEETITIWDATTGQELLTLKGYTGYVDSVAFSPDGKRIVSGSCDEEAIIIWDATTGQKVLTPEGQTEWVSSLAFSPDGKRIVSGGETITIWDATTCQELLELKGHTKWVNSVAFSPDGKRIVSGGDLEPIKIWDATTGQELLKLKGDRNGVESLAFSPDGKRIVSGGETITIWDATTGQELLKLKGHTKWVNSVAFSPDGKRIVSGDAGETITIWDATTGQELLKLKGDRNGVQSVAFSPDGKRIVSGSSGEFVGGSGEEAIITIWDATTGQELLKLKGHANWVNSVAFSPDGKRIVSGGANNDAP